MNADEKHHIIAASAMYVTVGKSGNSYQKLRGGNGGNDESFVGYALSCSR